MHCFIAGVPNLSPIVYPFSILTDQHVPLKFFYGIDQIFPKYFIITNYRYI